MARLCARSSARRSRPEGRSAMNSAMNSEVNSTVTGVVTADAPALSRRAFLSSTGALVVMLATNDWADAATTASATKPPLKPDLLDSYIAIERDGTVTVLFGKIDGGQGLETAMGQMVAEEIEVPFERVHVVMGDTARTINMGGASGATG